MCNPGILLKNQQIINDLIEYDINDMKKLSKDDNKIFKNVQTMIQTLKNSSYSSLADTQNKPINKDS